MLAFLIIAALIVISRKYNAADIDMITACSSVLGHVRQRSAEFMAKRPRITQQFLDDFALMIEHAKDIAGRDNARELRKATRLVKELRLAALNDLSDFLTFLASDFDTDKTKLGVIRTDLGFSTHYARARRSQSKLSQMLYAFNDGMPGWRLEIEAAGMDPALITRIIAYAQPFSQANEAQELLKQGRPVLTQEDIIFLNKLCRIGQRLAADGQKLYRDDPAVKGLFYFSKLVKIARKEREDEAGVNDPQLPEGEADGGNEPEGENDTP